MPGKPLSDKPAIEGGEHEGKGQDETEGPHLTVSGLGAGIARRFLSA